MNRLDKLKLNGNSELFSNWWQLFWFLDVGELNVCYTGAVAGMNWLRDFARPDIELEDPIELE